MKQIITTLLVVILLVYTGESKPKPAHYNNWIFGVDAGITFTTSDGNPKTLELMDTYKLQEGTSSISDDDGDLLYYLFLESTGLVNVISEIKSPQGTISNGDSILSGYSPSNSGLFIQDFTNKDLYYFISVADAITGNKGINYSIIDKTKNGGEGEVILKNKNLYQNATEKMTAVMNQVDNICWVITHEWGNDAFKIFRIDESGLDENIITQKIGFVHSTIGTDKVSGVGRASMSPNGAKLAITVSSDTSGKVQILDFDPKVGILSNPRTLNFESFTYSVCFSPNGKVLYVKGIDKIFQYDLSISDIDKMVEKRYTIDTKKSSFYETIERGPNGVIYSGRNGNIYLDAILNPDIIGAGCNYTEDVVEIGGTFRWGLPTVINSYFKEEDKREYEVIAPEYACVGDEFEVTIKLLSGVPFSARIERMFPTDSNIVSTLNSVDAKVSITYKNEVNIRNIYIAYLTTGSGKYDTLSFDVNGFRCCGNTIGTNFFNSTFKDGKCFPFQYKSDLDFTGTEDGKCPLKFTTSGQIASSRNSKLHNDSFEREAIVSNYFFITGDPTPNLPQRAWYQTIATKVGIRHKFKAYVSNVEKIVRDKGNETKELNMWLGVQIKDQPIVLKRIDDIKYEDGWLELSDEFDATFNEAELSIWVQGNCSSPDGNCTSYGFGIDDITLLPTIDNEINLISDTIICINDSLQFSNSFIGEIASLQWSPITGLSNPNILNPVATPTETTNYTLRIMDKYSCEFTDSLLVTVDSCLTKCIPCVTYSFEDMEVNLGEGYCLNASYFPSCADSTILKGISLYFEYDPNLMGFVSASASSQIIRNGDKNILRLDYEANAIKLNVFNNIHLCFKALLGNTDIAKLTQYEDENTKQELCVISADSATITYLACSFPIRKVKFTSLSQFDAVYNDNNIAVRLSTEETGLFKFVLTNMSGGIVKQDNFITSKVKYENENVLNMDVSDVSSGAYLLKMQTPEGKIQTIKILIVK